MRYTSQTVNDTKQGTPTTTTPPPYQPGKLPGVPDKLAACIPPAGPLHRYMAWAIKTTDADPLFHLASILPCWAHECCSFGFRIDAGNEYVPKLWTFTVGAPASSKSTAIRRALGVYRQVAIRGDLADPFVQAEGSVPGLFEALAERFEPELGITPGVVYRDEAARLLDTRDSVADMLCNIIDGDDVKRHLRGARKANREDPGSVADTLRSPTYSGLLATTFARLREVTKTTYLEGGLYSRFLWFVGPNKPGPQSLTVNPHREEEREVIRVWGAWERWPLGMQTLGLDSTVLLPEESLQLLEHTLFRDLQAGANDGNDRVNAMRKRSLTQATIVAGLYALSQQRMSIELDDMTRAIRLVRLCLEGYLRVDPTLAADPVMVAADIAFHAIVNAGDLGIAKGKLYPILRAPKPLVDQVLDTLLDEDAIELMNTKTGKRGRPSIRYRALRTERYETRASTAPKASKTTSAEAFAMLDELRLARTAGNESLAAELDARLSTLVLELPDLEAARLRLEAWRGDPVAYAARLEEQARAERKAEIQAREAARRAQEARVAFETTEDLDGTPEAAVAALTGTSEAGQRAHGVLRFQASGAQTKPRRRRRSKP